MAVDPRHIGDCPTAISKSWSFELKSKPIAMGGGNGNGNGYGTLTAPSQTTGLLEQLKENANRLLSRKWQKRQVRWDDQEWDLLEYHSKAYDTQSLMVSCGTVTMDRAEYADRKVLLIWNKNTRAWQLPKGRKNVHEDFAAAAMRETQEETGVAVQPLFLRFHTRLTVPESADDQTGQKLRPESHGLTKHGSGADDGLVNLLNRDIFCISQYPDPATGAMRHIYWYAAKPSRGLISDPSLMGVEDGTVMTARWFHAAEAVNRLKMSVERKAVALAVHYAEQMTGEEWKYSSEL